MSEIISDNYYAVYIYLDAFWRRRYLIAVTILLTPILVLLSTNFLPKTYEANIAIAINNVGPPSMKDVSGTTDFTDKFAGLQEYLRSPSVLKKVVIETKLVPPNASAKVIEQTTQDLNKNLTITVLEKSGIRISLIQNSPDRLTSILNALADSLIKQLEFQSSRATNSSVIVLENRLKEQKQLVKKASEDLSNYQNSHADSLPAYRDIYTARLREIITLQGNNEALYQSLVAEEQILSIMLAKMNPALGQIDIAIQQNESKLGEMHLIYTDNFPGVKARIEFGKFLKAEREKLYKQYQKPNENTLQQYWNMIIASPSSKDQLPNQGLMVQLDKLRDIQVKIKGIVQQIANLKKQQEEINKKLMLAGDTAQTLLKLNQILKNTQAIYDELLGRYNITKMTASMNSNANSINFQIIASPQTPISSLRRPLSFFFSIGILAGIFLGFGLVIIFEFMDNTIRYKLDVETLTNLKVICRVEKMSIL